jgi:formiminotetrahydrofolate cyclodeaminase
MGVEKMTKLAELSIIDFAHELGSDNPAPGGGSTAALAGALSCSLISMVAKITIKRSEDPDINIKLKKLITEAETSGHEFTILINDDTDAFNEIMKSFKLPKENDNEKKSRSEAIQAATKHAAEVPLKTARLGLQTLTSVKTLTEIGSENTITDTGVAGLMANSAIKGAIWNVKINLGSIKDSGFVQETNFELEKILESSRILWSEIQKTVEEMVIK